MKNILRRAGLALGLAASLASLNAFAQQPTAQDGAPAERHEHMGRRGGHRGMGGHRGRLGHLQALNLTDAQQQQLRAIHERYDQSFSAQRQELRQLHQQKRDGATLTTEQEARAQALRTELHESGKRMHDEVLALLTPEQRAQMEQMKQEHKARREQFRERRKQQDNNNQ